MKSSPRPWGCFLFRQFKKLLAIVFPTPVGVFLESVILIWDNTPKNTPVYPQMVVDTSRQC